MSAAPAWLQFLRRPGGDEAHGANWSVARAGTTLLAASLGAAIAMGRKDKMDLSVGIAMGSSIQIALFVTPVPVLASRFVGPERLTLSFSRPEIGALFLAVLIGISLSSDGRANWFKGAQLIGFYVILAALFTLLPELAP